MIAKAVKSKNNYPWPGNIKGQLRLALLQSLVHQVRYEDAVGAVAVSDGPPCLTPVMEEADVFAESIRTSTERP